MTTSPKQIAGRIYVKRSPEILGQSGVLLSLCKYGISRWFSDLLVFLETLLLAPNLFRKYHVPTSEFVSVSSKFLYYLINWENTSKQKTTIFLLPQRLSRSGAFCKRSRNQQVCFELTSIEHTIVLLFYSWPRCRFLKHVCAPIRIDVSFCMLHSQGCSFRISLLGRWLQECNHLQIYRTLMLP